MIYRSDNPDADFDNWSKEQQDWEDRLPRCEHCGEAIYDHVYDIYGEILCRDCVDARYRHDVEDYLR